MKASASGDRVTGPSAAGPLDGIRVVNLATMLGAGHATALLADFGADVITVELPGRGDALRQMGPFRDGESLRWAVVARNKRSLTLDLHQPDGQAVARDLVAHADVVVENFRPGTLARWGLGYDALRAIRPGIVLLSLSGYGQTGPKRHQPGFGRVIEAVSGIMHSTGDADGPPRQMGVPARRLHRRDHGSDGDRDGHRRARSQHGRRGAMDRSLAVRNHAADARLHGLGL